MTHRKRSGTIGLLVLVVGCLQIASAAPQDLFASMAGSWKGPGRIEFDGGASEALVCRAYYRTAQQANQLSIVLRCASQSNKIELRAKVATEGPGLTGTWEERTFNASGTATGQAMDGKIALSVDGGGFTATMLVVQDSGQQSVFITAQGVAFKAVTVVLNRHASDQASERDEIHD